MKNQLIGALAFLTLVSGVANASTMNVQYFTVTNPNASADFGPCCSSPNDATLPYITAGSSLGANGMPVQSSPGFNPAQMVNGTTQEILWWTPSVANGVASDGTGIVNLPFTDTQFYPSQGGGGSNINFFQTAILSGIVSGSGGPVTLNVTGDDDVLVYLNGIYMGGTPGVHGASFVPVNLGSFSGDAFLTVFYADRARTDAVLALDLLGGTVAAVPEPSTWAMMILGFAGVGYMTYRRRKQNTALTAA